MLSLVDELVTHTEISSALDIDETQKYAALLTRTLSTNSSMYLYNLNLYSIDTMKTISSALVYSTYQTEAHFVKFIPGFLQIVVLTFLHLKFYDYSNGLLLRETIDYPSSSLYDLSVSPDGKLVSIVGDSVRFWRVNGYRSTLFPYLIEQARYCSFAKGLNLLTVASPSQFMIFKYTSLLETYEFTQLYTIRSDPSFGDLTSIVFNPLNSYELALGFLITGPKFFNIDTWTFYMSTTSVQPNSVQNIKKVDYFPDGARLYSFDYLEGFGVWTGPGNRLVYRENSLLFGLKSLNLGTRLIGFIWQNLKIIDLQLTCPDGKTGPRCNCPAGTLWNTVLYTCSDASNCQASISRAQNALNSLSTPNVYLSKAAVFEEVTYKYSNATFTYTNGICTCPAGFYYDTASGICVIQCSLIPNALDVNTYVPNTCYCQYSYTWNANRLLCELNCAKVPFANSTIISTTKSCECIRGFIWNSTLLECVCPSFMKVINNMCVCYDQYRPDSSTGLCVINCALIANAINSNINSQKCACKEGYMFEEYNQLVGCRIDCVSIENGLANAPGLDSCICKEHTTWDPSTNECVLNCGLIQYSQESDGNGGCICAANYVWIPQINECGRNCTNKLFVNSSKLSTLIACPCIRYFEWNPATENCEINCTLVPNSNNYTVTARTCQCRPAFIWNQTNFMCEIDCSQIWDATPLAGNKTACACNNNKSFNSTKLSCDILLNQSFFENPLTIAGIIICAILFAILGWILLRFCWAFSTRKNKSDRSYMKRNRYVKKTEINNVPVQSHEVLPSDGIPTDRKITEDPLFQTVTSI